MKCHIAQNGGYMILLVYFWLTTASCSRVSKRISTIQDFCSSNLFIHNIEVGDPYELILKSEATAASNKWYQKTKRKCLKEFKTSDPAAHFTVDIINMTIPSCSNCRCNYFEISVQAYKKRYCGTSEFQSFSSKSDTVSIDFFHSFSLGFNVTLKFTVERNFYIITGNPSEHSHGAGSYLETPYFPNSLPPSYRAEYLLRSEDPKSHVVLLFLDFQISNHSFIEVVGQNDTHPSRYFGNVFRPPVIVSEYNELQVKFESNDQLAMPGFRALTSFIRTVDSVSVPFTGCGGPKDGRGGNMDIQTQATFSLYDCVWHIMLPVMSSTELQLSVWIQLKDIGYKSYLEFRTGPNSKSDLVKSINCEIENCSNLDDETIVPASSDLYIRFNGYLDVHSVVNMSYSTYHTGTCADTEFMCEDGRCLIRSFRCDGIKQCPSGNDEQECPVTVKPEITSVPNIKQEGMQGSSSDKFFILLLVGSFGVLAVLIAVAIIIYKYYRNNNPANVEQPQAQTVVGEMAGVPPTMHPSHLQNNDSPPSYDDFIKASNCYPPLLYTKVNNRFLAKDTCVNCTTSFSTGARTRYHSADSHSHRSSDTSSYIFSNNSRDSSQQTCPDSCSIEMFTNSSAVPNPSSTIRRWYSLDSKLHDLVKQDTCHLFLSIIHPVCNHASLHQTRVQCHTLPTNFKISTAKRSDVTQFAESVLLPSSLNRFADRRCTWSFVPHTSNGSEIVTVVKTRCCSDPSNGIRVHYSP